MFSAVSKTLGQMGDPPIRKVIGKTLGLAILGYIAFVVLVYLLVGWLAGLTGWLEGRSRPGTIPLCRRHIRFQSSPRWRTD